MHSDIGVGLVASSFALGRFLTTSLWPTLSAKWRRARLLFAIGNDRVLVGMNLGIPLKETTGALSFLAENQQVDTV